MKRPLSTAMPLALGLIVGLALPLGLAPGLVDAPSALAQGRGGDPDSACSAVITTTVSPDPLERCNTAEVQVTAALTCPVAVPIHMVIAVDRSQSLEPFLGEVQRSARDVLEEVDFDIPETEIGVLSHGFRVKVVQDLTDQRNRAQSAVNRIRYDPSDIGEDPGGAIDKAMQLLEDARETEQGATISPLEIIVLYGDGCDPTESRCRGKALNAASRAKGKGAVILTVCYDNPRANCNDYRAMATQSRYAYESPAGRLPNQIRELQDEGRGVDIDAATLIETLADGLRYQGRVEGPDPAVDEQQLTFAWADSEALAPGSTITATYLVSATSEGSLPLRTSASNLVLVDSLERTTKPIALPEMTLEVVPCAGPTPTPTAIPPTATSTPEPVTATPTVPPTTTPSPTATATATPSTRYAYMPAVVRNVCKQAEERTDVVLVIDASTSMLEQTEGQSKLDAAKAAALAFVKQLRAGDQAGVVAFNAEASLVAPLSGDLAMLEAAIQGIRTAQGTRIDRALAAARTELTGDRRDADNNPVLVLLTDGLPSGGSAEATVGEAVELRSAGVTVFAIGLGANVDADLLRAVAGDGARYFEAPSQSDLIAIYADIAGALPCPGGVVWPMGAP